MGSAGLEFDSNDTPEKARLNQKTTYISTSTNIGALGTTYPGQLAYSTDGTGGFTADTLYVRNAANTTWNTMSTITDNITEVTEANTTPVTDDGELIAAVGTRYYSHFTLPTTYPLYMISAIEWKTGATATTGGTVMCGVDAINADPPTLDNTPLLALGMQQSSDMGQGAGAKTCKNSFIASNLIRGGTICGAWVSASATTVYFRRLITSDSQKREKPTGYSATPAAAENTAFALALASETYIKVYYRGYY